MKKILIGLLLGFTLSAYSQVDSILNVVDSKYERYIHYMERGNRRLAENELNALVKSLYNIVAMMYDDQTSGGSSQEQFKSRIDSIFGATFPFPTFSYDAEVNYDSVKVQAESAVSGIVGGLRDTLSYHEDSISSISGRSLEAIDSVKSVIFENIVQWDSINKANDSIRIHYSTLQVLRDSITELRNSIANIGVVQSGHSDTVYAKNYDYTSYTSDVFEYPIVQIMPVTADSGVGWMESGAYIGFDNYDFGDGVNTMDIYHVAHPDYLGGYSFILGNSFSTPHTGYSNESTGGWGSEGVQTVTLSETISGIQDFYIRSDANSNGIIYWIYFYYEEVTDNINPTLNSASVSNSTRSVVNMTFSEIVNLTTAGWSMTGDSGAITINSLGNNETLSPRFNISRDIKYGESLALSYNKNTGNSVDLSDNELASFSTNITNNVQSSTQSQGDIFSEDFEDNTLGDYEGTEFSDDWSPLIWSNAYRGDIVNDGTSKRMQIDFPDGSFGWIGGAGGNATVERIYQWATQLDTSAQQLTFEYDVYFDGDFGIYNYAGKMPGLAANGTPGAGYLPDDEASFRYMFHSNQDGTVRIAFYMYYPGMYNSDYYSDSEPVDGKSYYGQGRTLASVDTGQWYNVKQVIDLGTESTTYDGGQGWVEGYIDGELKTRQENLWLRKYSSVKLDRIFFSNFFGGSGIEAQEDTYMQFDNFKVYSDSFAYEAGEEPTDTSIVSELVYTDIDVSEDLVYHDDTIFSVNSYRGYVGFQDYDFDQVDTLYIVYSLENSSDASIRILRDHYDYWTPQGTQLKIWNPSSTGSWSTYDTAMVILNQTLDGVQDLYLTHAGVTVRIAKIYFTETEQTVADGGGSSGGGLYEISHDQEYYTHENAVNNDYVGYFHTNSTDSTAVNPNYGDNSYSFSITAGNTNNAFAINSSSGLITVNDATEISYGSDYDLTVQVTEGSRSESYTANIKISNPTNTEYIDHGAASGGDGSFGSPHDAFTDVSEASDHVYFIKRGNSATADQIFISEDNQSNIVVAAYGQGSKPNITHSSSEGVVLGSYTATGQLTNIKVMDVIVSSSHSSNFRANPEADSAYFIRCEGLTVTNTSNNFYQKKDDTNPHHVLYIYDCVGKNAHSHNFKFEGSNTHLINGYAYDAGSNAHSLSYAVHGYHTAKYFYSDKAHVYGVEFNADSIIVDYVFIKDNNYASGIGFYGDNPVSHDTVRYAYIENTEGNGISVGSSSGSSTVHDIYFSNVEIVNAGGDGLTINEDSYNIYGDTLVITNSTDYGISNTASGDNHVFTEVTFTGNGSGDVEDSHTGSNFVINGVTYSADLSELDADYYLANNGNDSNNGTSIATPWRTISKLQQEIDGGNISGGDTIAFNGGDKFFVSDKIDLSSLSSSEATPIVFMSYGVGQAEITGYDTLDTFTDEGGDLWSKFYSSSDPSLFLRVNGEAYEISKYPEVNNNDYHDNGMDITSTSSAGDIYTMTVSGLSPTTDGYWENCDVIKPAAYWVYQRSPVTDQTGSDISWDNSTLDEHWYGVTDQMPAYLCNCRQAISKNKQWAHQNGDSVLISYSGVLNNQLVEIAVRDTLFFINVTDNIEINNLKLTGCNDIAIRVANNASDNLHIVNCNIQDVLTGFYTISSDDLYIDGNIFTNIGEYGLKILNESYNPIISNNSFNNVGNDIAIGSGDGKMGVHLGLGYQGTFNTNALIEYNTFNVIGYNAISINRLGGSTVRYNYIDSAVVTAADGGGIYCWNHTLTQANAQDPTLWYRNIITNTFSPSTSLTKNRAIYMDDYAADNIIKENFIYNGILHFHEARRDSAYDNVVYIKDHKNAMQPFRMMGIDGTADSMYIQNNVFALDSGYNVMTQFEYHDWGSLFEFDNNYYIHPFDTIRFREGSFYGFEDWKSNFNVEANSDTTPVRFAETNLLDADSVFVWGINTSKENVLIDYSDDGYTYITMGGGGVSFPYTLFPFKGYLWMRER